MAGYEKLLAPTLGYSNADNSYADILQGRGNQETLSLGHSRGTIVQSNAFNIAADNGYTNKNLAVVGVGGAVGYVTFTYLRNDPIPVIAAGNPGDAVAVFKEFFNVVANNNSAHSCYGSGAEGCSTIANPVPGGPVPTLPDSGLVRIYRGGELVSPTP